MTLKYLEGVLWLIVVGLIFELSLSSLMWCFIIFFLIQERKLFIMTIAFNEETPTTAYRNLEKPIHIS